MRQCVVVLATMVSRQQLRAKYSGLSMCQVKTFNLLTIERELGWVEDLGFNSLCLS
jgi:hypothetical protein